MSSIGCKLAVEATQRLGPLIATIGPQVGVLTQARLADKVYDTADEFWEIRVVLEQHMVFAL